MEDWFIDIYKKSIVAQIGMTHQLISYANYLKYRYLSHQITKIMPYNTSYKKSAKLWDRDSRHSLGFGDKRDGTLLIHASGKKINTSARVHDKASML